jgi:hypothetical protein
MNTNGQPKLLWWISGAILGPIVLATLNHVMVTTYATSEKASALEAEFRAFHQRLDRLDRKIDLLLERKAP